MKFITAETPLATIEAMMTGVVAELAASTLSLEAHRRAFDERGASVPLPDGVTLSEICISETVSAELLSPQGSTGRTIIYFHGGGYSTGSAISHRPLCARIAQASHWDILCVNYRLVPEHKFPSAVEDAVLSYDYWLAQGHVPDSIVLAGDSAGGGLAIATLLAIVEDSRPMPAGLIGLSPWLDLACSSASYETHGHIDQLATSAALRFMGCGYLGNTPPTTPLASPFYAPSLAQLCPLLLQVGSVETLRDEVIDFAGRAEQEGVTVELQVWENMIHVWHSFGDILPESGQAIRAIAEWLSMR